MHSFWKSSEQGGENAQTITLGCFVVICTAGLRIIILVRRLRFLLRILEARGAVSVGYGGVLGKGLGALYGSLSNLLLVGLHTGTF